MSHGIQQSPHVLKRTRFCARQELADEYGKHRATEFNVGSGSARRGTGVSYADVAGIDHVKADIEAMMEAVLGKGGYSDIGMRPPRVRGPFSAAYVLSSGAWARLAAMCLLSIAV